MEPLLINPEEKAKLISDHWKPRIMAELNGQQVKIAKFQGEFEWHSHAHEDELFLVLSGSFVMQFKDRNIEVKEGEMLLVPRGTEHCPLADNEVCVMLFEPAGTLNTGQHHSSRTVNSPDWI